MKVIVKSEISLTSFEQESIANLLQESFLGYPKAKTYHPQIPHSRIIALDDQSIIGQVSLILRTIRIEQSHFQILGLTDVCVDSQFRNNHVASSMIEKAIDLGTKLNFGFVLLTTDRTTLYRKFGFQTVENNCRWLLIHNGTSFGIVRRPLTNSLMIKRLGIVDWPPGEVDFLGHIF